MSEAKTSRRIMLRFVCRLMAPRVSAAQTLAGHARERRFDEHIRCQINFAARFLCILVVA